MDFQMSPVGLFIACFALTAFAGLAALLRLPAPLTIKSVASSVLNCGLLGLGISLLWYTQFQQNTYFLVGACVILGLSGMGTFEFIIAMVRTAGLNALTGMMGFAKQSPEEKKNV